MKRKVLLRSLIILLNYNVSEIRDYNNCGLLASCITSTWNRGTLIASLVTITTKYKEPGSTVK